jgi:hypothetical protein
MRNVTTNVNNAQWGSVTGGGVHAIGTEATLTAVPAEGCEFVCWNNYDPSLTVSFTVFADTTVTATFTPIGQPMHILTVQAQDETMGAVSGSGIYSENTDITISATANDNYHFMQWSDGATDNPRTLQIVSDSLIMAIFAPDTFMINTIVNDDAMGTVDGGGRYAYNSTVILTANPAEHHNFDSWLDGNTDNPRTITVTGNATYVANFVAELFIITVTSDDETMGTVYGSDSYAYNSVANISAYPNQGYEFVRWNDDNTDNPRDIVVMQDSAFVAYFRKSVGINQASSLENISVYPNPATTTITINSTEVLKVEVLDMTGRLLMVEENTTEIDLSSIADGIYTLRIVLPQGEAIRKVVKMASK